MNAAIFVTPQTRDHMNVLAEQLLDRQKQGLVGRLVLFKPSTMPKEQVEPMFKAFSRFFEAREMVSVRVHASGPFDSQVATMLAMFMLQRYATAAGPWLIIDAPCGVRLDNPLSVMENFHRLGVAAATGRCDTQYGGRMPLGPVVFSMLPRDVKPLIQTSGESWRMRGRHCFGRLPWKQMSAAEYPFTLTAAQGENAMKPLDNPIIRAVRSEITAVPETEAQQPGEPGVEPVEVEILPQPVAVPILESTQELETELPTEQAELPGEPPAIDLEKLSDEDFAILFKNRTGKVLDKRMSRANAIKRCEEMDTRP